MAATIALVDDDQNILTSVGMALEEEGYILRTFSDGETALAAIRDEPVDLVLLDIKMPRLDGFEMLRRLRQQQSTPVIFLTSKDDEVDEELGLRMGGDDYVTKPFRMRLLLERIRAVLRRAESTDFGDAARDNVLTRGGLVMDADRHDCWWHGRALQLTQTEFLLLWSLAYRPGHVKTRQQLMDVAYGENVYVDDRTVDSHIKRLRKKFRNVDPQFDRIETMYAVGYRFKDD